MNIEKLLKKIERNGQTKQQHTARNSYKIKTCESVGTLNSVPDQDDQSFIIHELSSPITKNNYQIFNANVKLDLELSKIQKMKNMYESRQNHSRLRSCGDKHSASSKKSLEKHLLRPSNTPSFTKSRNPKQVLMADSSCKNLYKENCQNQSFFSVENRRHDIKNKMISFQYPEQKFQIEILQSQPYEDNLQENSNYGQNSTVYYQNQKYPFSVKQQSKSKDNLNLKAFVCQENFESVLNLFSSKIQRLTERMDKLEQENGNLKAQQYKTRIQVQKYRKELCEQNQEKQKALFEVQKQKQQKQELELLLKDVLYKRERERMLNSKENTFRENQSCQSDKKFTHFSFAQTQNAHELKAQKQNMTSHRQSESKMKVQNLLHKLQIKADRV